MVARIVEASAYLLAGIGFGHAGTLLLWDWARRKAHSQAAHDADVARKAIDAFIEGRQ